MWLGFGFYRRKWRLRTQYKKTRGLMTWQITIGYAVENIRYTSEKGKKAEAFWERETDWDG